METAKSVFGRIANVLSPKKPAKPPVQPRPRSVPPTWLGVPTEKTWKVDYNFPCIGRECVETNTWHEKGTHSQPFYDRDFEGTEQEYQHMCDACVANGGIEDWRRVRVEFQRALAAERAAAAEDAALDALVLDAEEDAMIEDAEEEAQAAAAEAAAAAAASRAPRGADANEGEGERRRRRPRPRGRRLGARWCSRWWRRRRPSCSPPPPRRRRRRRGATAAPAVVPAVAPPPNAPLAPVADARTEPVFLSHVIERQELGKAMWDEMASEIPRPQHDGSLKLPTMGAPAAAAADLERLRRQYPSLPYVKPNAAARGMALIDASPDGVWTDELKQRARAGFEAEAAGVEVCVCFPELFAREYLMEDERYRTGDGVKTPCMCCKSNKFVLMGSSLNVGTKSSQRYAYGDNRAIFVVSCHYHCFNPDCSSVQRSRRTRRFRSAPSSPPASTARTRRGRSRSCVPAAPPSRATTAA